MLELLTIRITSKQIVKTEFVVNGDQLERNSSLFKAEKKFGKLN
jgi:hypothetical protein